ncbi:hypothetical protein V8E54_009403 [Elaphomyces granulatus]
MATASEHPLPRSTYALTLSVEATDSQRLALEHFLSKIALTFRDSITNWSMLSCVRYIREHAPAKPAEITATQRKHLNLLDGIALLLVTEDKSDMTAVSFLQNSKTINFFYAKNRPCTASEKAYIGSLLELIRNYDPSKEDQYTWDIVNIAVRTCLRKVRNRIQKLSKELRKSGFQLS